MPMNDPVCGPAGGRGTNELFRNMAEHEIRPISRFAESITQTKHPFGHAVTPS